MSRKRRSSRLFSGQPGLLLVSEDIPGIIMPAPPSVKDLPPLEEEDTFDLEALHAEEDAAESEGHEGPLRVFLGAPGGEESQDPPTPEATEAAPRQEDGPIWDVSALAMPEAPEAEATGGAGDALDFLDEDHDVADDDVVSLDTTPPPLVMQVSLDEDPGLSAGDWSDESPTMPAIPAPAVIRDDPPPVHVSVQGDPLDVPDRTPFAADEVESDFFEDASTRVEALVAEALGDSTSRDKEWEEDEVTFFGDGDKGARTVPESPPSLRVQPPGNSGGFRPIPEKVDPPVIPILVALIGIVVVAVVLVLKFGGSPEVPAKLGTADNPIKARQPGAVQEAPAKVMSATQEPVGDVGFLTIESDSDAIIYVGDQKMGTTPLTNIEVPPGNHRVLAMEVETGARKPATAVVVRGQYRRIVFKFR